MTNLLNRVWAKVEGLHEDVSPHHWRLPSSYSASSKGGRTTVIPHPSVFRNALISNPGSPGGAAPDGRPVYPDISHAAVHLALLECFRNLRHSAAELGIKLHSPPAPSYDFNEKKPQRTPTFEREAESEQWNLLIHLAITRFQTWWTHLDQVFNHAAAYTHHGGNRAVVQLNKDYLPPLDVLLVWYAFMLEPEEYQRACIECEMPHLTKLCFPWPAIRDLIDFDTMTLTITRPAESLFKNLTEQSADILQYIQAPPAYTEPSMLSPTIDFFTLVKKQDPFLDLSHKLLWIRSPALVGSLERSFEAYFDAQSTNNLFFMSPNAIVFGIDLIWRTHRLYPAQYSDFREAISDTAPPDQLSRPVLDLPQSSQPNKRSPSLPPPQPSGTTCLCWTCERLRDDLPTFSLSPKEEPLANPAAAAGPPPSPPPWSTSSYTTPSTSQPWDPRQLSSLSSEQLHYIKDDLGFHHAVEAARRQGLTLPTRPPTAKEKEAERREKQRRESAGRGSPLFPDVYVDMGSSSKWRKWSRKKEDAEICV
ncbi:hypothetical protein DV736_g3495, partial [Chaetothyriales sp. CBS 134916]